MFVMLASVGTSSAQPAPDAIKQAEQHFERGEQFRKFGNFDEAIREFLAGYELTGSTEFLFNAGQAYREKGDKRQAVAYYKKYLALDPNGDGALFARSHVELLEKEIRAEDELQAARRQAEAEAERTRKAEAELTRKHSEDVARREAQRKVAESDAARRVSTSRWLRGGGLAAGATGLATLGIALYFGHEASTLSEEASHVQGAWTEALEQKFNDAESAQTTMFVLLGVGGAAVASGGLLYYLGVRTGRPADERASSAVTVTPVRGGAGVFVGGRF
jgi:tetratricopeptide (TPR) repeat protein